MKTLYIDVYFFINFCTDALALSISAYFLKLKCGVWRLCLASTAGALYAVLGILLADVKFIMPIISVPLFLIMIEIVTHGVSLLRKFKYTVAFFLSEIVIGGLVYYGFCLLERAMEKFQLEEGYIENRNLLILAIIILLSYAVVKFMMTLFGSLGSIKNIKLCVGFSGNETSFEAIVDSGNLARDPQGGRPVVFITHKLAQKIIGENFEIGEGYDLPESLRRKFRIIPVKRDGESRVLYGFISDYVTVVKNGKYENIDVSFAIDMKGDTYGGYPALVPASAIENVF